jgi:hypothetical protein
MIPNAQATTERKRHCREFDLNIFGMECPRTAKHMSGLAKNAAQVRSHTFSLKPHLVSSMQVSPWKEYI